MKPVMEHYIETGRVLGKDTDELEGYSIPGKGRFGPMSCQSSTGDTFEFPHGTREDWLFYSIQREAQQRGTAI